MRIHIDQSRARHIPYLISFVTSSMEFADDTCVVRLVGDGGGEMRCDRKYGSSVVRRK